MRQKNILWKLEPSSHRGFSQDSSLKILSLLGHAIAAVSMAAAGLRWDVKALDGLGYEALEKFTGVENFPKFKVPSRPVKGSMPEIVLFVFS